MGAPCGRLGLSWAYSDLGMGCDGLFPLSSPRAIENANGNPSLHTHSRGRSHGKGRYVAQHHPSLGSPNDGFKMIFDFLGLQVLSKGGYTYISPCDLNEQESYHYPVKSSS